MSYKEEYLQELANPEKFWQEKANNLEWFKKTDNILTQNKENIHHWFADWQLNTCYMALDYHVKNGAGNRLALIYDSPVTNKKEKFSYQELLNKVALCAGMLKNKGVEKGDRVIIYMPMIPEAVIAMLACARLGAIHSVVFGGFAAPELAIRIDDAKPKIILSASCGIEITKTIEYKPLLDKAIMLAQHKVETCIIYQREEHIATMISGRDYDWTELIKDAKPHSCVTVRGDDLLYILYTSGTTGKPKGVIRENGGHAVAMKYSMQAIYDIKPSEVFWAASDVGWVVGHSYIVYAPLINGSTTILYEGKPIMTPDAGAFWRVIEEYQVKALFTAPTAFRAIKKEDPNADYLKDYDVSCLKTIFSAGERLDPPTYEWLNDKFKLPVIDHWWQTETGWAISANLIGIEKMPIKAGSSTVPAPGYHVEILDENGKQLPPNVQGNIAIKLPLPPSCLTTIWQDIKRFKASYLETYPGYYVSGDGGYFDDDGYLFVMGRVDDVINVAGHRLSTGEMEEVVGKHKSVAECAVIGRNDELKGQMPVGFVVLKSKVTDNNAIIVNELIQLMRTEIGAVAAFKEVYVVSKLPKTRSGKILRKTIRQICNGEEYVIPSTIDDITSLNDIENAVK